MASSFNTILDEAALAAGSLDGAREALRSQRVTLEEAVADRTIRAAQQSAVADLGRNALGTTELTVLLDDAMAMVAETLDLQLTSFLQMLPEEESFLLRSGFGWPQDDVGRARVSSSSRTAPGRTLELGKPLVIADWAAEEALVPTPELVARKVTSSLFVGVSMRKKSYGVIAAHSSRTRYFASNDVHFLEVVANVLAAAIERKQAEEDLTYQALHDHLTGLPNRVLFVDRLTQALSWLDRHPSTVALLFVDVDRFKVINDSLGHDAGDQILMSIARRLQEAVRAGDTLARFGGD